MVPIRRHRRRAGTWIAIYALLLQALIPFGQALPGAGAAPLVVCKVAGYGTSTAPDRAPSRIPGGIDAHGCVVCTAIHGACGDLPETSVSALPFVLASPVLVPGNNQVLEQQLSARPFLPRGPPIV